MNRLIQGRPLAAVAGFAGLLLLAGCQGTGGGKGSFASLEQGMPGDTTRTRHAHIIAAIETLETALAGKAARFDEVTLDPALYAGVLSPSTDDANTREDASRRLAEAHVSAAGAYRLQQADTLSGRLEYRSTVTDSHLAVYVRKPTVAERDSGAAFVVTDLFTLESFASAQQDLAKERGRAITDASTTLTPLTALKVGKREEGNDVDRLSYLNALPHVERERDDVLALRAMLMMRLDQDRQARSLVEQGIVRYPASADYLTLAAVLFERASANSDSAAVQVPKSLAAIMAHRFKSDEIRRSRKRVTSFLAAGRES